MDSSKTDDGMGCCSSNVIQPAPIDTQKEHAPKDPPLSNKDVETIQSNWKSMEEDPQGYGLMLFKRLFEQHPDIQKKFYFAADKDQNIAAIMADAKLASHAKGVIDTITFAVSCLHDLSGLVPILKQLGAAHAKFQLEDKHFQAVGGALMWTLGQVLGTQLDESARKAWLILFNTVAETMKLGVLDAEKQSESS